ncbi:hypothetical protein SteCoe_8483 [Stentor coeruleus]|uniref:Uncharacterized protein n=1 Tax=Stentor coeruleus TaxID=5963 RepID=A0A1R2CK70_9CILI|nr:hypothetical protein SteCoe_8483 [Stentor coeruleus]
MESAIEEQENKSELILPPIFGGKPRRKKNPRNGKSKRNKNKILFDSHLRSKASSVLNSSPPHSTKSTYKTSRITHLSVHYVKYIKGNTLMSSCNISSINSIEKSHRLNSDISQFLKHSKIRLPSINKSSLHTFNQFTGGLFLEGNKKEILGKQEYCRAAEESKRKVKEIALYADLTTEEINFYNNTLNSFLNPNDKAN